MLGGVISPILLLYVEYVKEKNWQNNSLLSSFWRKRACGGGGEEPFSSCGTILSLSWTQLFKTCNTQFVSRWKTWLDPGYCIWIQPASIPSEYLKLHHFSRCRQKYNYRKYLIYLGQQSGRVGGRATQLGNKQYETFQTFWLSRHVILVTCDPRWKAKLPFEGLRMKSWKGFANPCTVATKVRSLARA